MVEGQKADPALDGSVLRRQVVADEHCLLDVGDYVAVCNEDTLWETSGSGIFISLVFFTLLRVLWRLDFVACSCHAIHSKRLGDNQGLFYSPRRVVYCGHALAGLFGAKFVPLPRSDLSGTPKEVSPITVALYSTCIIAVGE